MTSRVVVVLLLGFLMGAAVLSPTDAAQRQSGPLADGCTHIAYQHGCSVFLAADDQVVLAGNNEDWRNPLTKLWFVPASEDTFGQMYVGFDNNYPQGGMNDQGLFFDGLAVEPTIVPPDGDLPQFPGILLFHAMSTCADVQCVVDLFSQYDRSFMVGAQLFYGDASGDAVIIEPVEFIRKTDRYLVSTNFYQSATPPADITCERYQTAQAMLAEADTFTSDLFRDILDATHQTGDYPTQYSNIYDLTARTMTLYLFHDFDHPVEIDLAEELAQGAHAVDIISLFPENNTQAANWRDIRVRDYEAFMKRSGYYDPDVDTSGFAAYAGRYAVPQALIDAGITTAPYIELTFSDGWLAYDLPGDFSPPARLYPASATSFIYAPFDARIVLFYGEMLIGVNGDIRGIQVLLGDTPVIFERLP